MKIEPCKYCPRYHQGTCDYIKENLDRLQGVKGDSRHAVNIRLSCHDYYKTWSPGDVGIMEFCYDSLDTPKETCRVIFTGWTGENEIKKAAFCIVNEDISNSDVPYVITDAEPDEDPRVYHYDGYDLQYAKVFPYEWILFSEKYENLYIRIKKDIGKKELCPGDLREKGAICDDHHCWESCVILECFFKNDYDCKYLNKHGRCGRKVWNEDCPECPAIDYFNPVDPNNSDDGLEDIF